MAGIGNNVVFGQGYRLQSSLARDITDMQRLPTDISDVNFSGDPNGNVSANPGSMSHDPVSGNIWQKATGTGNTGWVLMGPSGVSPSVFFEAYLSANQTFNQTDDTQHIVFDTAVRNVGSGYDASTGTFTAPKTGLYYFTSIIKFADVGSFFAVGYKGSVNSLILGNYILSGVGAPDTDVFDVSWTMQMTAGDTVQVQPYLTGTGPTFNIFGTTPSSTPFIPGTYFSGFIIEGNSAANALYPITPYVVGPIGFASYQTIQSAITDADAAGGGAVWIQPGTYTENLTLSGKVQLVAATGNSGLFDPTSCVTIVGVHTPNTTGLCGFNGIALQSATDVINSAVAGTATFIFENCIFNITNGYILNIPNWTGIIGMVNLEDNSANNGILLNNAGSFMYLESCDIGNGTANPMITTGVVSLRRCDIACPWTANTGTFINGQKFDIEQPLTLSGDASGDFNFGKFTGAGQPAITMSSTSPVTLQHCTVDSTNNPAIDGAGSGLLTLADVTFTNNSNLAGTLTVGGVGGYMPGAFGNIGEVFTSNGPGVVPSFQPASGGSSPVILTASQTLTAAEIRSLNASPVTLIPAQGANTQICVVGWSFLFNYGGTNAFADGSTIGLYIGTTVAGGLLTSSTLSTGTMNGALSTSGSKVPAATNTASGNSITNLPLIIAASSTEYTGNAADDNTLKVQVLYYVTTLS